MVQDAQLDRPPPPGFRMLAHRGYAAHYPENTLRALRAAAEAGAAAVEFDVQITADGVPVLLHDETLSRTAGIDVSIGELHSRDLPGVCVGEPARFGSRFAAEPLPTLAEAVQLLGELGVTAFVEIKVESLRRAGREVALRAVLAALDPIAERSVLISFDVSVLEKARERSSLPLGWCVAAYDGASERRARALAPAYLLTDHRAIPDGAGLWRGPWHWVVYEVADAGLALRLWAAGADVIETMAIGEMLDALGPGP